MYFFSTVNMIHQKEENNGVGSETFEHHCICITHMNANISFLYEVQK